MNLLFYPFPNINKKRKNSAKKVVETVTPIGPPKRTKGQKIKSAIGWSLVTGTCLGYSYITLVISATNSQDNESEVNRWLLVFVLSFLQDLVTVQVAKIGAQFFLIGLYRSPLVKFSLLKKVLGNVIHGGLLVLFTIPVAVVIKCYVIESLLTSD